MNNIKIFRPETYTDEIISIRKRLLELPDSIKYDLINEEFLADYMDDIIWKEGASIQKIHNELIGVLNNANIVLYHNTRIYDKKLIEEKGLVFSDERYIDSIRETLLAIDIEDNVIDKTIYYIKKEQNRWIEENRNRRVNEVCFMYDIDYCCERGYAKYLASYGGEFLEFGLNSYKDEIGENNYKKIIKAGKPFIVESDAGRPAEYMDMLLKLNIARYMLEEWIHIDIVKDKVQHEYDSRIEKEVPPENIMCIHEVDDDFPQFDEYLIEG